MPAVGLRTKDIVRATGLHERTIRGLERKGVIQASRDRFNNRIYDPSVIEFLRRHYRRVTVPTYNTLDDLMAEPSRE